MLLPNCDKIHKVTVVSRGMALGLTIPLPEDRVLTSKAQLLDQEPILITVWNDNPGDGAGGTADAVRDQLHAAGIEIEDSPRGSRWTLEGAE